MQTFPRLVRRCAIPSLLLAATVGFGADSTNTTAPITRSAVTNPTQNEGRMFRGRVEGRSGSTLIVDGQSVDVGNFGQKIELGDVIEGRATLAGDTWTANSLRVRESAAEMERRRENPLRERYRDEDPTMSRPRFRDDTDRDIVDDQYRWDLDNSDPRPLRRSGTARNFEQPLPRSDRYYESERDYQDRVRRNSRYPDYDYPRDERMRDDRMRDRSRDDRFRESARSRTVDDRYVEEDPWVLDGGRRYQQSLPEAREPRYRDDSRLPMRSNRSSRDFQSDQRNGVYRPGDIYRTEPFRRTEPDRFYQPPGTQGRSDANIYRPPGTDGANQLRNEGGVPRAMPNTPFQPGVNNATVPPVPAPGATVQNPSVPVVPPNQNNNNAADQQQQQQPNTGNQNAPNNPSVPEAPQAPNAPTPAPVVPRPPATPASPAPPPAPR